MTLANDRVVIKSHWSFLIKLSPFLLFAIAALLFPFFYGYHNEPIFLIFLQSVGVFQIIQLVSKYSSKIIIEGDRLTLVENFKKTTIKFQSITEGLIAHGDVLKNVTNRHPLANKIRSRNAFLHLWLYIKAEPQDLLISLSAYSSKDIEILKDRLTQAHLVASL